jgi:hypothetical protein
MSTRPFLPVCGRSGTSRTGVAPRKERRRLSEALVSLDAALASGEKMREKMEKRQSA